MRNKNIASMLFKMHLKPRKKATSYEYYMSNEFADRILVAAPEMGKLEMIAKYWPNYEFLIWFADGDLVIFETEGGEMMRPIEIVVDEDIRKEILDNARGLGNQFSFWEEIDEVRIEGAGIWVRAL